jgi:uncharacterized DUF497 family protein
VATQQVPPFLRLSAGSIRQRTNVYTLRYNDGGVASEIEFDWDDENRKHLAAHQVAPAEFEQMLNNDPVDLEYDRIDNEERYRSVGLTNEGRLLSVAWTVRNGKVRAITAFPATVSDRKAFLERPQ